MKYFGTELTNHGHFIWDIDPSGTYLTNMSLNFKQIPFNPEEMPRTSKGERLPRGTVRFYQEEGYTICAIEGSCIDTRPGSKSVFWVKEEITNQELKERILSIPITRQIIEKMPFKVDFLTSQETV